MWRDGTQPCDLPVITKITVISMVHCVVGWFFPVFVVADDRKWLLENRVGEHVIHPAIHNPLDSLPVVAPGKIIPVHSWDQAGKRRSSYRSKDKRLRLGCCLASQRRSGACRNDDFAVGVVRKIVCCCGDESRISVRAAWRLAPNLDIVF